MSSPRIGDAGDDRIAVVAYLAPLVAQHAGPNLRCPVSGHLRHEIGVGDLSPGHLDAVAAAIIEGPRRLSDIDNRALCEHRRRGGSVSGNDVAADGTDEVEVEALAVVQGGTALGDGEDRPSNHDEVVDHGGDVGGEFGCSLWREAGPWGELVTAQPEAEYPLLPKRAANGFQDLPQQECSVLAVPVVPPVRQAREKLAQETVLPCVDLYTVEIGGNSVLGGVGEAVDDRRDVVVLHDLGDFAGVDLRLVRGRPQWSLVERRRALPTGVADCSDDETAVRAAGVDDGRPAFH